MYRVPLFSAVFPSRRTTKAGAKASMFQIRNWMTNGLAAAAFAFAALGHTPTAHAAATERVVYSFCSQPSCTDGAFPQAALTSIDGTLYGTASFGGTGPCTSANGGGCGTVFSLDPATGTETVLHSFQGSSRRDGFRPAAGLLRVGGLLYGTTVSGGTSGYGTVFSVNPATAKERVLYSFQGNPTDGALPYAALTSVNGSLYGTTQQGGTSVNCYSGCGTVFLLNPATGTETVLHSFRNDSTDGLYPNSRLISVNSTLYGTTYGTMDGFAGGLGTVFSFNPATGIENVLHFFSNSDGNDPAGDLISVNGTLYGTTESGGGTKRNGTVFSVSPTSGGRRSFILSRRMA
jgi:uncharacterized repeat protein (TIGR03803 family)